eukprot:scaffold33786_cov32-Tisochrysis_lutea.AAC.4
MYPVLTLYNLGYRCVPSPPTRSKASSPSRDARFTLLLRHLNLTVDTRASVRCSCVSWCGARLAKRMGHAHVCLDPIASAQICHLKVTVGGPNVNIVARSYAHSAGVSDDRGSLQLRAPLRPWVWDAVQVNRNLRGVHIFQCWLVNPCVAQCPIEPSLRSKIGILIPSNLPCQSDWAGTLRPTY